MCVRSGLMCSFSGTKRPRAEVVAHSRAGVKTVYGERWRRGIRPTTCTSAVTTLGPYPSRSSFRTHSHGALPKKVRVASPPKRLWRYHSAAHPRERVPTALLVADVAGQGLS